MRASKDKFYIYIDDCSTWVHRTPLKVIVNPILRFLQFWTNEPWVIGSDTDFDKDDNPHFQGYCWVRAEVLEKWKDTKRRLKK